jgi:hypothetical protein
MGEGALAGMPLQLAGSRKILEFMDWGDYGAKGTFINIGSIGISISCNFLYGSAVAAFDLIPLLNFYYLDTQTLDRNTNSTRNIYRHSIYLFLYGILFFTILI